MPSFGLNTLNSQDFSAVVAKAEGDSILKKVGSFLGSGAEISAYDPATQRLFVISGGTALEVLDLSNPSSPTLLKTLDVAPFGGGANSVALSKGVVAVAVQAQPATSPGKVVFFNADGDFLNQVTVGALPDMLTFTPDGQKVLVANEGEPSSYGKPDSVDPVGSISIIDLSRGVASAIVTTAGFESFNGLKADLQAKGVRITGPGASVAQDLEPEYITVSADSKTAWVTLQENNAIAVVDIATSKVTSLLPLGLKDYSKGLPTVTNYDFTDLPTLGETVSDQEIKLGGFSGLSFEGVAANGNLKFITHTDRGPNAEPAGGKRPFLLPDFQPQLVRFELNQNTGTIAITEQIGLTRKDGTPLTGLPNLQAGVAGTAYNDEIPVNLLGQTLPNDPLGGDFEGIAVAPDGSFWLSDEYRPALYHFDRKGTLIDRFIPEGAPTATGEYGTPALPAVYAQRRTNRGFEAIALEGTTLYTFIQSALDNPDSAGDTTSRASRNLRVLAFDTVTQTVTGEYLYILDSVSGSGNARTDKIGDAVSLGNGKFLVVERDDRGGADSNKLLYEIDLKGATNFYNLTASLPAGKTLEQLTVAELSSANLKPVSKRLAANPAAIGYTGVEKLEGLARIDANTFALLNDNDFGVGGSTAPGDGTLSVPTVPDAIKLGILKFDQSNGLDASDRDGGIKIQNQPVFGLYQPDAIARYVGLDGNTYLITANEGDARDYDGFQEEIRVGDSQYLLDPTTFPNAAVLKNAANLGRLTVSKATGDLDGDGDFDQIQVFGSRSFSIRDINGNLVFDSGDQFERITAAAVPTLFNSNGTAATFDTRSDNKGPEPEGLAIGLVDDRVYAFIGLERTGGVMVYDVTNQKSPKFLEYISTTGDVSPEGLTFIPADQSSNGTPLLVVTNEVSRTTAVFEFNPTPSGAGGQKQFTIEQGDGTRTVSSFGGVGQGVQPAKAVIAEADTLKFVGADLTARNLLLTQVGRNLELTFENVANTKAVLRDFQLDNLDNLSRETQASVDLGNILFDTQTQSEDSFDVFNADWDFKQIFNRNSVTFLNDLDNDTRGFNRSNDVINGQGGNDRLHGLSGDDLLRGGDGDDVLFAGSGADILIGGAGNDTLYLGRDRDVDTVIYRNGDGSDVVNQFTQGAGGDLLKLEGIAAVDVVSNGSSTFFHLSDNIGGNVGFGSGQLLITLNGTTGLTAANLNLNVASGTTTRFLFA